MDQRTRGSSYRVMGHKGHAGRHCIVYTNDQDSVILFKARTNNLTLNDRKRFRGEDTKCDMCGAEKDLKHFLLCCRAYTHQRRKSPQLQQPYKENEDDIIGKYILV